MLQWYVVMGATVMRIARDPELPVTLYGSQAGALDAGAGIGMAQP
jgi:hypothetical protein